MKKRRTQGPYSPHARRFCLLGLFVCEMELLGLEIGVAHGVQLIDGLAGQHPDGCLHIQQGCPEIFRRPAAVALVIQTCLLYTSDAADE